MGYSSLGILRTNKYGCS
ncbi:hypothetical protein LINGRAHAP2_LOCUS23077 [Linum grandiflorum]